MREIKFRAWKKDTKEMYPIIYLDCGIVSKDTNEIVMQFTGLKDKNGKEIYEGDKVLQDNETNEPIFGVVKFQEEDARFIIYNEKDKEVYCFNYDIESKDLKIVGNVYEKSKEDKTCS